jgi:hypothetical protein
MAAPGASVKLRRLRQRFGIAAPKVSVRTHYPWYWRALAVVVMLSVSLAVARWIYDAGRSIAGYDSSSSVEKIEALKARIGVLTSELAEAKAAASVAESNLKVDKAAQLQLASRARELETENAALKQDLAFFEGLLPDSVVAPGESGVRINRFRVERDSAGGQYRYRLLIVHNPSKQQKEMRGELQFSLKVQQQGKDAMILVPPDGGDRVPYRFEVRHFQRSEGVLPLPAGTVLKSVEVRIIQDGVVRARQSLNL